MEIYFQIFRISYYSSPLLYFQLDKPKFLRDAEPIIVPFRRTGIDDSLKSFRAPVWLVKAVSLIVSLELIEPHMLN